MIKTREELLNSIKERFGDDTSDDALAFIEDVTDTLDNYESKANDTTDWKTKYEENDKEWREKYRNRFFEPTKETDEPMDDKQSEEDEKPSPMTFEELFK